MIASQKRHVFMITFGMQHLLYAEWTAFKWARSQPEVKSSIVQGVKKRILCAASCMQWAAGQHCVSSVPAPK